MSRFDIHAVITGDVIGSSRLADAARERLVSDLYAAFEAVRKAPHLEAVLAFEVFRGDSWQLYVSDPSEAFHVALAFRAQFKASTGTDTRLALAVGRISTLDLERVSQSDGDAFTMSGRGLDSLRRRTIACWLLESTNDTRQRLFDAIASGAGAFASEWTQAQAQAVALALLLDTEEVSALQEEIASVWKPRPVRQQTVSEHLVKARWDEIAEFLDYYLAEIIAFEIERAFGPQT